jgi:hypothetical protein
LYTWWQLGDFYFFNSLSMAHYVCTGGCGGESDKPGVCQAEDCPKEGQPLVECNCEDGIHDESSLKDQPENDFND